MTVEKFNGMGEELLRYGGNSSQTATTMQQMQDFMVLQANTVKNLTDGLLWQPETSYERGTVVHSPNIPAGYIAEAQSEAGQTGSNEPGWDINYSEYTDGTVTWTLKKILGGSVQTVNGVGPDGAGNIEIDTGANTALDNIDENLDFVVDSYHDSDGNWWRKFKSGWVEQGGIYINNSASRIYNVPINLNLPMANDNYSIQTTAFNKTKAASFSGDLISVIGAAGFSAIVNRQNETMFYLSVLDSINDYGGILWAVSGQGANE